MQQKSIQYFYRIKPRNDNNQATNNNSLVGKLPPLVVRFTSNDLAKDILQAFYKSKTELKLSEVSNELINSRVYLSEHLSQHTLKIFRECQKLKRDPGNSVAKVLTRDGNVFVSESKDKSTRLIKISTLDYLQKKFVSQTI